MTLFTVHVNGNPIVRLICAASANAVIAYLSPAERLAGYLIVARPRAAQ